MEQFEGFPQKLLFDYAYSKMIARSIPSFLHEINNPLTALSSGAKMLDDDNLERRFVRELMSTVAPSIEKLVQLSDAARVIVKAQNEGDRLINARRIIESLSMVMNAHWRRDGLRLESQEIENHAALNLGPAAFALLCYTIISAIKEFGAVSDQIEKLIILEGKKGENAYLVNWKTSGSILGADDSWREAGDKTYLLPFQTDQCNDEFLGLFAQAVEAELNAAGVELTWRYDADEALCSIKIPLHRAGDKDSDWIG